MVDKSSPVRRWRLVVMIAIVVVGGVIATLGFRWADSLALAIRYDQAGPALTMFIVGYVIALGALIAIRVFTRPHRGRPVILASIALAGVALLLTLCIELVPGAVPPPGWFYFVLGSLLVDAAAVVTFLVGLSLVTARLIRAQPRRSVIYTAVLGGVITAGAFIWVAATGQYAWVTARYQDDYMGEYHGVSTAPGVVAYFLGLMVLCGGLFAVRMRTRPRVAGHLMWVSAGIALTGLTMCLIGLAAGDLFGGWLAFEGTADGIDVVVLAIPIFVIGALVWLGRLIASRARRRASQLS
jgi:hypothetical protein